MNNLQTTSATEEVRTLPVQKEVNGFRQEYRLTIYGDRHGTFKEYYPTGELFLQKEYVNGKEEGIAYCYGINGKPLTQFFYKNGNWHGVFELFDCNGNVYKRFNYDNGRLIE